MSEGRADRRLERGRNVLKMVMRSEKVQQRLRDNEKVLQHLRNPVA